MTKKRRTRRDEALGRALRSLEVPEHATHFQAELRRRLRQERPALITREHRSVRRTRLRWVAGLAVVVALAFAYVVIVPVGERQPPRGPGIASAAEIKAKVRNALANAEDVSGVLVLRGVGYQRAYGWTRPMRWEFAFTSRGDFRLTGITRREAIAYDASEGVERSVRVEEGEARASEALGLAPGPPDPAPSDWILERDFAALVRALLAARDPRVSEVTYKGRPAWRLAIRARPNAIVPEFSGDRFEITVDQQTGFPVRIVERKDGRLLDELRLERLRVNTAIPHDQFTLAFPPDAPVSTSDAGFRRVDLADVEEVVGYEPLVPGFVPRGYKLTEIAVARNTVSTGSEGANPPSRMVVSLSYRRGLDQLLVTTRLARVAAPGEPQLPPRELWSDPLASGEGFRDAPESITISGGALDGAQAELVLAPRTVPHIWALTDRLVVTISGDLSRSEVLRVAGSLSARQP